MHSHSMKIFFKTAFAIKKFQLLRNDYRRYASSEYDEKKFIFFITKKHIRFLKKKKIFFLPIANIFQCDGGAGRNFCKNFLVGGSEEIAVCGGHLKYCINWWVSQQRQVRPPFFPMFCTFLQLEKTRIFSRFFTPHHVQMKKKFFFFIFITHSATCARHRTSVLGVSA